MKTNQFLIAMLIAGASLQQVSAQFGFSHEIGFITGPVAFQSDYGLRNDWDTNRGNIGWGIGLIHYLNFAYRADCNCYARETYFNDHFKVRNEIDYHFTNLGHEGEFAEKDSDEGRDLRDHTGSSSVFEIGTQLEYFPKSIRDFTAGAYKVAPYISAGVHFVSFDPTAQSSQGPITATSTETVFDAFLIGDGKYGGIDDDPDATFAITFSAGARIKLGVLSDLLIDARWHYYDSNWVDGLNPAEELYPANKYNDWIFWLNFGYVYYLN